MFEHLESMASRYRELEQQVVQPELATAPRRLREVTQEMATLREAVEGYARWKEIEAALEENRGLRADRRKHRRRNIAVRGVDDSGPGLAVFIFSYKFKGGCDLLRQLPCNLFPFLSQFKNKVVGRG